MGCKRYYYTRLNGLVMQHFAVPEALSHKAVLTPHNGIDIDVRQACEKASKIPLNIFTFSFPLLS